jgi:hypothetical protein
MFVFIYIFFFLDYDIIIYYLFILVAAVMPHKKVKRGSNHIATIEAPCDIPPLSKDDQSKPGSLRGVITEVMTHNTIHTRIKHMKCSES